MDTPSAPTSLAENKPRIGLPGWLPPLSLWVGITCGLVGVIAGVTKVFHRVEAQCPNGKSWGPGDSDFTCYSHPQLGTGIAIVAGSVMGALLIMLVACLASEFLHRSADGSTQGG